MVATSSLPYRLNDRTIYVIAPMPKITKRNRSTAIMRKIANRTLAMVAAPRATPVKPNAPATTAITSAIMAHVNKSIFFSFFLFAEHKNASASSSERPQ
jgi:hypothetical protein